MSFEEFNNFNDAENFILENINIHDYDEYFLVVDKPDVFFVYYDEDDVAEMLIQSFHDYGSDSFERYQRHFDIYAYVTREQKERHPFLYRNSHWVDKENGNVFKQKMYAESEYVISVSLSAY